MTRNTKRRRSLVDAIVALLLILVVAACGGDEEDSGGGDGNKTNEADRPDQLAFVSKTNEHEGNLVVMDTENGNQHTVVEAVYLNPEYLTWWFLWSPDGSQIMYRSWNTAERQEVLHIVDADGGNRRSIIRRSTERGRRIYAAAWSPDGSQVAFSSISVSGFLTIVDADGGNQRSIEAYLYGGLAWSPDSRQIVYSASDDVFVVDSDGQNVRNLTDSETPETQAIWSPDGSEIAFVRGGEDRGLMLMDANGDNIRPVADVPFQYFWSPDGSRIVYFDFRNTIYVVDADGANQRELHSYGSDVYGIEWLPDSDEIIVSGRVNNRGVTSTNVINIETGERQEFDFTPFGVFSQSPDGSQLVTIGVKDESDTPGLYIMNMDGSNIQRLADADAEMSNPVWRPR